MEAALRDVQLWDDMKDRLNRNATHLTLEQQQKLCIARLLPLKPRVILMDEPCSALDAEGVERIEMLITELRSKFTILIVTHNMGQAHRASDECIFMLLGRTVECGKTVNLFLNPREKETEMYVTGRYDRTGFKTCFRPPLPRPFFGFETVTSFRFSVFSFQ